MAAEFFDLKTASGFAAGRQLRPGPSNKIEGLSKILAGPLVFLGRLSYNSA